MTIEFKSPVSSPNVNNAFMSRGSDTSTTGKIDLLNASSTNVIDVQQVINDLLSVSLPPHNDTTSKQGGTTNEFYHLTSAEETRVRTENTPQTISDDFAIGDGTDTDKTITAQNGDANEPKLKYDSAGSKWQFSNDGVVYTDIGAGGGGGGSTSQAYTVQQPSSSMTNLAGEVEYNLGTATIEEYNAAALFTVTDDAGNTRTILTATSNIIGNIAFDALADQAGTNVEIYRNGVLYYEGTMGNAGGRPLSVACPFILDSGDYLSFGISFQSINGSTRICRMHANATEAV